MTKTINPFILLLVFVISCAPQKYGRHFSNHPDYSDHHKDHIQESDEELPVLSASNSNEDKYDFSIEPVVDLKENREVKKDVKPKGLLVKRIEYQLATNGVKLHWLKQKPVLSDSLKTDQSNQIDQRIDEPIGLLGTEFSVVSIGFFFAAGILSIPVLASLGYMLLVAGFVLGIISLKRIKHNPEKWKGKGHGLFSIILFSVLLLLALLFVILIISIINSGGFD